MRLIYQRRIVAVSDEADVEQLLHDLAEPAEEVDASGFNMDEATTCEAHILIDEPRFTEDGNPEATEEAWDAWSIKSDEVCAIQRIEPEDKEAVISLLLGPAQPFDEDDPWKGMDVDKMMIAKDKYAHLLSTFNVRDFLMTWL